MDAISVKKLVQTSQAQFESKNNLRQKVAATSRKKYLQSGQFSPTFERSLAGGAAGTKKYSNDDLDYVLKFDAREYRQARKGEGKRGGALQYAESARLGLKEKEAMKRA